MFEDFSKLEMVKILMEYFSKLEMVKYDLEKIANQDKREDSKRPHKLSEWSQFFNCRERIFRQII